MRIFTIAEILAGGPGPGWAAEMEAVVRKSSDTWREPDGQEWTAGAWAAVNGEPDPSLNCLCAFRRGYDWAASRALSEGGWEAWNLAYREVVERRPIGRSSPHGARYYGCEHESVPAEIARLKPFDVALWKALHGMQGSLLRWAIYRELGAGDAELRLAISREFGTVNSGYVDGIPYAGYGCRLFNDNGGGKHSSFHFDAGGDEQVLSGRDLVDRARSLLCLAAPGTLLLSTAPGSMPHARRSRRKVDVETLSLVEPPEQLVLL